MWWKYFKRAYPDQTQDALQEEFVLTCTLYGWKALIYDIFAIIRIYVRNRETLITGNN